MEMQIGGLLVSCREPHQLGDRGMPLDVGGTKEIKYQRRTKTITVGSDSE